MILFENTQIAFQSKSNTQLFKAYFLFKLISFSKLVKVMNKALGWSLKLGVPIKWLVKPTVYGHFVGGESIHDCQKAVRNLEKFKVKAILDYSVEGKESQEDIRHALSETLRSIENAGKDANIPFAVFKPTAFTTSVVLEKVSAGQALSLSEESEANQFRSRVNQLCEAAYKAGVPILIDAEDSWYQNFIDEVVESMMELYNKDKAIVYNTLQMYRHDRLDFLAKSYEKAVKGGYFLGIKFVRGAYMEKERERALEKGYPSPIQPDKESTDRDYNLGLKFCMEHLDRISIFNGTHNEFSSAYLAELMQVNGIAANDSRIFFAQLYGMSDHISFNLANAGYNVAKYVPYGPVKHVMPYLFRRAEENTSVAGQTGRELRLLSLEKNRRRARS
ncbi:MAG: proline dehydrogenase family protein [Bacteroidales bacterium]|nr:proline dehydrogenase family protein [Bacteroidales bacterium]